MSFALGQRSLSFCTHVDPRLIAVVQAALAISSQDAGFAAEQSRTAAEEAALVAKGFSHTLHSHHIIDCNPAWAAPGCSGAVDLVPWNGSAFVWEWWRIYSIALAMRRASIALKTPVTWGGCWDRLLEEIDGDDAAAMQKASADYCARQHAAGNPHPFCDGPHFEDGRN